MAKPAKYSLLRRAACCSTSSSASTFGTEDGAELLDLPRLPIADPATPAPVRFLPVWDATLLVHARNDEELS